MTALSQAAAQEQLLQDVTAAQRRASDPQTSVWVGASAGSGKTKVLADRVSRLLLDGASPQRLLCLTFTRAAAAEMSIRLTQRLSHWATCADDILDQELCALQGRASSPKAREVARRLFAQVLACPGGMRILTIHGFAQEILRRFPVESGLAPHFTVMDEVEAQTLREEALGDLLQHVAQDTQTEVAQAFALLVASLGESRLRGVLDEISKQQERIDALLRGFGGFDGLERKLRARLGLREEETESSVLAQSVRDEAFDHAALLEAARLVADKASPLFARRAQAILNWLAMDTQARQENLDSYLRGFLTGDGNLYAKFVSADLLKANPDSSRIFQEEGERLLHVIERLDSLRCVAETLALLRFTSALTAQYRERKGTRALLDYDDLIAQAVALLSRPAIAPWVLFKLDGGIDHILVDESQDTNPAQWEIVRRLADAFFEPGGAFEDQNRTIFCVGDEKQSIFSFQGADVHAFARMRAHFANQIHEAQKPFEEVPLNVSFRSAPAILRAVDAVFAKETVRAGVSRDLVAHSAFRFEGSGRVEVLDLFVPPEKKSVGRVKEAEDWVLPLGYEVAHEPALALAEHLAARIKSWLDNGEMVFDKVLKAQRAMHAGDVMILVRTRNAFVDHVVRALKRVGVEVSGVDRMRLTQQLAVMDLMALAQFVLLPEDDLTLACVLRGPLIGAQEEDLMALSIGRSGSLWSSLCTKANDSPAYASWVSYLHEALALADQATPLAFLMRHLTQPCPADAQSGRRALATRLGPDAEDPLDELLNAAEAYGAMHVPSLQGFLHYLVAADADIKREMEQTAPRVRITTVHASKGLESPVVIMPDTTGFPERRSLPRLLWDEREGLPFYIPRDTRQALLSLLRDAAFDRAMQEYRRLLYVAMTRAADRLCVCGYMKDRSDAAKENWYNLIVQGLLPLHQDAVESDVVDGKAPSIILADYATTQKAPIAQAPMRVEVAPVPSLPPWILQTPPAEPTPPRPLVPSRWLEEDQQPFPSPNDARFARGRIIHRLLQSLPDCPPEAWHDAAMRYLSHPQQALPPAAQEELGQEVLSLLRDERFAPLFGPDSRAEQPIVGLSGDRLIAGQVDRLALVGDEVWVVDYKTNRPPPIDAAQVPLAYRSQMDAYRSVLSALYPARKVRCFLLWTYSLRWMEIV